MKRISIFGAFIFSFALECGHAQEVQPVIQANPMKPSPEEAKRKFEELLKTASPELQQLFRDLEKKAREAPVRPRLTQVNQATLLAIPAADLDSSLVDYVYDRMDGKIGAAVPLTSLPRGLQVFFVSYLVEAEVMNGGFSQFFWNSSSQYANLVPAALRELNATDAALVFEKAQVVAASEDSMRTRLKAERTLEAFSRSYQETRLETFDAPFCKLAEGFPELRARFVKLHPELFTS